MGLTRPSPSLEDTAVAGEQVRFLQGQASTHVHAATLNALTRLQYKRLEKEGEGHEVRTGTGRGTQEEVGGSERQIWIESK